MEKLYSDVLTLDSRVRASIGKSMGKKLVSLPEGRLWKDHAPAKVDQRKVCIVVLVISYILDVICDAFTEWACEQNMFLDTQIIHKWRADGYIYLMSGEFGCFASYIRFCSDIYRSRY